MSGSIIPVFAAENVKDNSMNIINTSVTATTNSANNTTITTNNNTTTTNNNSTGVIYIKDQVKQKPVLTLKECYRCCY